MIKKSIKKIVLGSLVLPLVLGTAFAAYPDKPIKMLVGYAPGSSTDIVGRMVANELSIALKQSVIVEIGVVLQVVWRLMQLLKVLQMVTPCYLRKMA